MANVVKTVAIEIIASTKGLDAGLASLQKSIAQVQKEADSLGTKMSGAASRYQKEVDKVSGEIVKKETDAAKQKVDAITRGLNEQLAAVKGNAAEEYKVRLKAMNDYKKLAADTGANVAKQLSALKGGKPIEVKDIFKINQDALRKDIDDIAGLQRDLKTTSQKINNEMADAFKKARQIDFAESKAGFDKIKQLTEKSGKEQIAAVRRQYAEMIEATEKGSRRRVEIEAERNKKLASLMNDHRTRMARVDAAAAKQSANIGDITSKFADTGRLTAGGKIWSKIGDDIGGMGKGIAGSLGPLGDLGGSLASVTSKLGPVGLAATAAVGAIAGIGMAAVAAAQKFNQFEGALKDMGDDMGIPREEALKLGEGLMYLERPANISAAGVTEIAGAVSHFAEKGDIEKITQDVLRMAGDFEEVDPKKLTEGLGRLSTAVGDADVATKGLNATALALKGKSIDPLGDAAESLNNIFMQASVGIEDSGKAMDASRQVFEAFVGTGMDVGKATKASEAVFKSLNKVTSDPGKIAAIQEELAKTGKTLADVGLEAGKLDFGKAFKAFQDGTIKGALAGLGEEGEAGLGKVDQLLSTIDAGLQKSGKSIGDFGKAGGLAVGELSDNLTSMAVSEARLKQDWENFVLTMGSVTEPAVSAVYGVISDAVSGIGELFKSNDQQYKEAMASIEGMTVAIGDVNALMAEGATVTAESSGAFFDSVNAQMEQIASISPEIADQLQAAMSADNLDIDEKIALVNNLLEQTGETAKALQGELAGDAIEASWGKVSDQLNTTQTFMADLLHVFETFIAGPFLNAVKLILEGLNAIGIVGDETIKNIDDTIHALSGAIAEDSFTGVFAAFDEADAKLNALREQRKALMVDEIGNADQIKALNAQIAQQQLERNEALKAQNEVTKGITEGVRQTAEALAATGELTREGLQAAIESSDEYASIPQSVRESAEFQEMLNGQLDQQVSLAQATNAEKEWEREQNDWIAEQLNTQLYTMYPMLDVENASNEQKLAALQLLKGANDAQIMLLETAIAAYESTITGEAAVAKTKNETLKVQNEINKAQGVGVQGTVLANEAAKAELSKLKASLSQVKREGAAIDAQISKLQGATKKADKIAKGGGGGAKGGGGAGRAGKSDEDKQAEKDAKEAADRAKKLEDERHKAVMEEIKNRYAELEKREKAEDEARKLEYDRQDRMKKFNEDLKSLKDNLKARLDDIAKSGISGIGSLVSEFFPPFTTALLDSARIQTEYQEKIKGLANEAVIAEKELSDANAAYKRANDALDLQTTKLETERGKKPATYKDESASVKDFVESAEGTLGAAADTIKKLEQAIAGAIGGEQAKVIRGLTESTSKDAKILRAAAQKKIDSLKEAQAGDKKIDKAALDAASQRSKNLADEAKAEQEAHKQRLENIKTELKNKQIEADQAKERVEQAKKRTEVTKQAASAGAQLGPIGDFTAAVRKVEEVYGRLEEISKLEKQAAESLDADETNKILDEAEKLRVIWLNELANEGETQEGLLRELFALKDQVQKLADEKKIELTAETEATLKAVESLADATSNAIQETEKIGDAISFTQLALIHYIQNTAAERDAALEKSKQLIDSFKEDVERTQEEIVNAELASIKRTLDAQIKAYETRTGLSEDELLMLKKIKKERENLEQATPQIEQGAKIQQYDINADKATESITKFTSAMERMLSLFDSVDKGITDIKEAFGGEVLSTKIESIANLTTDIGKALLASPIPQLKTAGAIILGVGLIGKLAAKLSSIIERNENTAMESAQKAAEAQERIVKQLENRVALLENIIALGSVDLDQAWERLEVERKTNDERRKGMKEWTGGVVDLGGLSDEQLTNKIDSLNAQLLTAANDAQKQQIQLAIDMYQGEVDARIRLQELADEVFQEGIDKLDFIIESEREDDPAEAAKYAGKKVGAYRDALQNELGKLSEDDLGIDIDVLKSMGQEQFDNWIQQWIKTTDQASPKILDLIKSLRDSGAEYNELLEAAKAKLEEIAEEAAAMEEDLFSRRKGLLEKLRDVGTGTEFEGISEEEYFEKVNALLRARLAVLEAQGLELEAQGATELELLDNELARKDIELEILGLTQEQNGALSDQDKLLVQSIKKRQDFLKQMRAAGGTGTAEQRTKLAEITEEAVAAYKVANPHATDEEIEKFRKSLPQFKSGGFTGEGGLAVLHPGEYVLRKEVVDMLGRAMLEKLNSMQVPMSSMATGNMTTDRFLAGLMAKRQAASMSSNDSITLNFGDLMMNNTISTTNPQAAASAATSAFEDMIYRAVNKGIQSGKIDPRR